MSFDKFPLDQQRCMFRVGSYSYDDSKMKFKTKKYGYQSKQSNGIALDYEISKYILPLHCRKNLNMSEPLLCQNITTLESVLCNRITKAGYSWYLCKKRVRLAPTVIGSSLFRSIVNSHQLGLYSCCRMNL